MKISVIRKPVVHDGPMTRGFTLLELLTVLLILSLVAAIVVPSLGGGAKLELKAAARTLASGLRQTRNEALNHNRSATLSVDVDRREFQVPGEQRARKLPRRMEIVLYTARSEQLNGKRGAIRFFPDGSSTGGRITLSMDSLQYLVNVDWLTGRVIVMEPNAEKVIGQ